MQSNENVKKLLGYIKKSKIKVLGISLVITFVSLVFMLVLTFYNSGYLIIGIALGILLFFLKDKYKNYCPENLFEVEVASNDENGCILKSNDTSIYIKDKSLMQFTNISEGKKYVAALSLRCPSSTGALKMKETANNMLCKIEGEYKAKCWKVLGIFILGLIVNGVLTNFDYIWISKINLANLAFTFSLTYWICISNQHKILMFHTNCSSLDFDEDKHFYNTTSEKIDLELTEQGNVSLDKDIKDICFMTDILDISPASNKFKFSRNRMFSLPIKQQKP